MNKYVFFLALLGMPSGLIAGPFDVFNAVVAAPLVIGAALVGADLGQERRDREAYYRRQEYQQDQKNKRENLAQLDREYEVVQNAFVETEQAIARLSRKYESLQAQIAAAEREKQEWQSSDPERRRHLASLREQLGACTVEYERALTPLKIAHDKRMSDFAQEAEQRLADLRCKQNQEVQAWELLAEKEDAALDVLREQKRGLESRTAINDEEIESQKRALADLVIESISSGKADACEVVNSLALLGRNKDILYAAEHARNVSLLVALIVSKKFKAADLTTPESDYQSIPKSFFRTAKRALVQTDTEGLPETVRSSWVQQLDRMGRRTFLCCPC